MKVRQTEDYEVVSRKAEKREKSREVKAEKAAVVERHIEEILLDKLKKGVYDDIYNVNKDMWDNYLTKEEVHEKEEELDYEDLSEDEEDTIANLGGNFEGEGSEPDWENESDEEKPTKDSRFDGKSSTSTKDSTQFLGQKKKKNLKIEYEREEETEVSSKKKITAKIKGK